MLNPPHETTTVRPKDANPPTETDVLRLRPMLVKAGTLLREGTAFLADAWARLPQVKVQLWWEGVDPQTEL